MEKLSVFVADDEDVIREGICNYVPWDELGFQLVGNGYDGEKVLEFLSRQNVDVLITDIQMPKYSGLEIAEILAAQKKQIRVVLITGYDRFEFAQRAIKTKLVHDFIVKPIQFDELIVTLRNLHADILKSKRNIPIPALNTREVKMLQGEMGAKLDQLLNNVIKAAFLGDEQKAMAEYILLWEAFENNGFSDVMIHRSILELVLKCSAMMYQRNITPYALYNNEKDYLEDVSKFNNRDSLRLYGEYMVSRISSRTTINGGNEISPLIKACASLIQQEYSNPAFCLQYVARKLHVSSNYLSTCFKKEMGVGFLKYVNSIRIIRAQELLREVSLKTYEIANMVGLEDSRYFSRLFKEQTGMTPNEYRTALF